MSLSARWVAALVAALALVGSVASGVLAQPTVTGPSVSLDHMELQAGGTVVLTIDGFQASNVTISICGNEARRGSVDCNMTASEGVRLNADGSPTIAAMPVAAPPAPCPCVIRVSNETNDEVAIAAMTLLGHPTGPVVDPPVVIVPLLVSVSADWKPTGLANGMRAELGGPATYQVTVKVSNQSTLAVHHVTLSGSVGRGADDFLLSLPLTDPGEIPAGRASQQVITVKVPSPSFGSLTWRVTAAGAGPSVDAEASTRHRPTFLIVLLSILVVDIFLFLIRRRVKRRARRTDDRTLALARAQSPSERQSSEELIDAGSANAR